MVAPKELSINAATASVMSKQDSLSSLKAEERTLLNAFLENKNKQTNKQKRCYTFPQLTLAVLFTNRL